MRYLGIFLLVLAAPSIAQTTYVHRIDGGHGLVPSHTIGVVTPYGEGWIFTFPAFPDVELGKLFTLYNRGPHSLLGGGYAATWTKTSQYFALPWLTYNGTFGRWKTNINLASYQPLNGGPTIFFSDESSVVHELKSGLSLGIATTYWSQAGATTPWRFGPILKATLNKSVAISARYLGVGSSKHGDTARLEVSFSF